MLIGGVTCEVALSGTLELVFVTADSEFSVELENALYSPNLRYNLFSPSAEFDGKSWYGLGPDGVMTAFDGHVTSQNFDGMLIATAYLSLIHIPSPRDQRGSRMPSSA